MMKKMLKIPYAIYSKILIYFIIDDNFNIFNIIKHNWLKIYIKKMNEFIITNEIVLQTRKEF